jgi:hypothetical protein
MNQLPTTLFAIAALVCVAEGEPPKPKPAAPKPQPSVRDLANAEARKADANYDGRISGPEVTVLRGMWRANPKIWLYLFDDNGNKVLDDAEIAEIEFKPAPRPTIPPPFKATPKPGKSTTPKPVFS